ncbi:neuronal PAS domain-containing protein 4-like isoform X2 [Motacilla alba alba]|uniref:neuronal PAS domain-containing protein 4-like isoform X2 n=1 Tax=Motacilla alba alba TaxID=1094192 RepID=UPI0018D59219|nr:neuronal PAS domain-containing protein 4-like isoform X2 [Motacilla alba alba]
MTGRECCPFPSLDTCPSWLALQVNQECFQGSPRPDQCGAAGAALPAAHLCTGKGAPLLPPHHGPGVPPAAGGSAVPSRLGSSYGTGPWHGTTLPSPGVSACALSRQQAGLHLRERGSGPGPLREVTFVSEMRTSKAFRLQHGGNRVVAVCGRFVALRWPPSPSTTAFLALCTPVVQSPTDGEAASQDDIFQSMHLLDMTFIDVTESVTYHLGYHREELVGQSWYSLLHPEDADLAAAQHRALALGAGAGPAAGTAVLRVLRKDRAWSWLRVWARRDGGCITCTCRCLREEEAAHLRARQPRAAALPAGRDLGRLAEQLRALADSLSPPAAAAPCRWPRPEEAEDDASVCLGNSLPHPAQFLRFPFEQKTGRNIPSVLSQCRVFRDADTPWSAGCTFPNAGHCV